MSTTIQPMPPLSMEQLEALRDDIAANGVLVPVTLDQYGRIIDGNNRAAIADELGIEYPIITVEVADDDAAIQMALTLNCARRHLTQEQRRHIIRAELRRCEFRDSDRAIGRRVGCDHKTVGSVRSEMRERARESTDRARAAMKEGFELLFNQVVELAALGADLAAAVALAEQIRDEAEAGAKLVTEDSGLGVVKDHLHDLIDWWIYAALATELDLLQEAVTEDGWTQQVSAEMTTAMKTLLTETRTPKWGNSPVAREV